MTFENIQALTLAVYHMSGCNEEVATTTFFDKDGPFYSNIHSNPSHMMQVAEDDMSVDLDLDAPIGETYYTTDYIQMKWPGADPHGISQAY